MKGILGFLVAAGALGVGLAATLGGDEFHLSGARVRRRRGLRGADEQRELHLYIDNDSQLYHSQTQPIMKNLAKKLAKGVYDRSKAEKLWMYLVEAGAKKYVKEFGGGQSWHELFSMADRKAVAKELNDHFLTEHDIGNR